MTEPICSKCGEPATHSHVWPDLGKGQSCDDCCIKRNARSRGQGRMNWLRDILGICRRHHISNQWDGIWLTYICPKCFNEGRLKGKQDVSSK